MATETVKVPLQDIPEGRPYRVSFSDRRAILVCKEGDTLAVFLDRCPHQGMSMRHGTILQGKLVCPYHKYQFALEDGSTNMRRCEPATAIPFEIQGDMLVATVDLHEVESVFQRSL